MSRCAAPLGQLVRTPVTPSCVEPPLLMKILTRALARSGPNSHPVAGGAMAASVHHTARLGVAHTAHLCGHGCICRVPGMRLPDRISAMLPETCGYCAKLDASKMCPYSAHM